MSQSSVGGELLGSGRCWMSSKRKTRDIQLWKTLPICLPHTHTDTDISSSLAQWHHVYLINSWKLRLATKDWSIFFFFLSKGQIHPEEKLQHICVSSAWMQPGRKKKKKHWIEKRHFSVCGLNKQNKGWCVFIHGSVRWILSRVNKSFQLCCSGASFFFLPLQYDKTIIVHLDDSTQWKVKSRTFLWAGVMELRLRGKVVDSKCIPEQPAAQCNRGTFNTLSARRRRRNAHNLSDKRLVSPAVWQKHRIERRKLLWVRRCPKASKHQTSRRPEGKELVSTSTARRIKLLLTHTHTGGGFRDVLYHCSCIHLKTLLWHFNFNIDDAFKDTGGILFFVFLRLLRGRELQTLSPQASSSGHLGKDISDGHQILHLKRLVQ